MNQNQFFRQGSLGCLVNFVITFLAICAMVLSTNYHYPEHPLCGGMLGAGYPALFICDDWGGGSPTSSWGKITFVDIPNGGIRPTGFFIDFVFYMPLIWIVWLAGVNIFRKHADRSSLWWATFISLGFISGCLCAYLLFRSSSLYLGDTYYSRSPTPIIPSATPLGTQPALMTPVATSPP